MTAPADIEVRHGFTLGDLQRITSAAVRADRLMAMPYEQRRDIAWSAIAEHLCTVEEPPIWQELVRVGWQAIYREVRDGLRERGYADGERDWTSSAPTMPRFARYWEPARVMGSHEDRVIEKYATGQVMDTITGVYRDAVVALAVHDDYMRAADALGITYSALRMRLITARRQFLARWHEGETPYRPRRTDRRVESHGAQLATHCGKGGHEWTPENTRTRTRLVRGKLRRERVCRGCERVRDQQRRAAA